MNDDEAIPAILKFAEMINELNIAYIHLSEADWDDAPTVSLSFRQQLRKVFNGAIIVAGNNGAETGAELIDVQLTDFVAYGRKFLANPDLPYRFKNKLPLNEINDMSTLFGGDKKGYTDYPSY